MKAAEGIIAAGEIVTRPKKRLMNHVDLGAATGQKKKNCYAESDHSYNR